MNGATAEKLLSADLQSIGQEATRRRFAPLKEVVDRALQQLQAASKDSAGSGGVKDNSSAFATADHVWYAFAMAARAFSGNHVLVANACHSLGKAASLGLVPPAQVPMAAQMLAELVVAPSNASGPATTAATITNSSDVELRVLQAVGQLSGVVDGHPVLQQEPLSLSFHMYARSPHAAVRNAALATVTQISNVMLQWLVVVDPAASAGARSAHDEPSVLAQRMAAARLFRDLCAMATGRPLDWLLRSAHIAAGEPAASLPLEIVQTFLTKCPPAVEDAVPTAPLVPTAFASTNTSGSGSSPAAVFSRCVNDSVMDLLTHSPSCVAHTQAIDEADHQRAELFARIHCLIVTAVTRHLAACEISTVRAALEFHSRFIATGGRYHPLSAAHSAGDQFEDASQLAIGTEECITLIVAAWRKAFAASEFLQRLAVAEATGNQDVSTLLASVGDEDDDRINPLGAGGHHRTQSNSSDGASSSRDLSLNLMDADEDCERRQQRAAALAAAWQSTACVKLLAAAPTLLETTLLAVKQHRQLSPSAQAPRASPAKGHHHHDPNARGNSPPMTGQDGPSPALITGLMAFNTMLTQSLARWFEQVVRQRPTSLRSEGHIGHRRALALVGHTYGAVWSPVYSCCSLALSLLDSEETLHSVLKILTHLAHCATMARDSQSRDAVLRLLSDHAARCGALFTQASKAASNKAAKPLRASNSGDTIATASVKDDADLTSPTSGQLTAHAHLQRDMNVISTVVSMANAVGDSLDDGWYIVVEALIAAHDRYTAILTADPKFAFAQDVESIRSAITSIFDSATKRYPPCALRIIAECLSNTGGESDLPPVALTDLQAKQMVATFSPASITSEASQEASPVLTGRSAGAPRNGTTLSDPMQRSINAARFIAKAFSGMINAVVPPSTAEFGEANAACATVAVHIWPFLRLFLFRACSTPGYTAELVAQILSCIGDIISSTAATFASTDGHADDPRTVVIDAALHLIVETYVRSDTFFSANADCSPSEARTALLKETVRVAQTRSHAIRTKESWRSIFRMVEHATTASALDAASGYRILELVRGNAVTQIAANSETLNAFIGCAGKCICQSAAPDKISNNLSAVQLLWSVADFAAAAKDEESGSSLVWNRLLVQLRDCADDDRVDIKHSCLKTLFSLLISNSEKLPKLSWPVVCWQIMLALLERHVVGATAAALTGKQADDVKQTVVEGISRVVRMYHMIIGASVADATAVIERIFAALYKCVLGTQAEGVTFAAVKAIGGILVDLCPYPHLLSLGAIDTAFLAFEQLVATANKPLPAGAVVSLNSLKCMIENTIDGLTAARSRPLGSNSWTESSEETYFHRIVSLLESVGTAHAVVTTFMFPCSVPHALMSAIAKLASLIVDPDRRGGVNTAQAWDSLHRLVISAFPTLENMTAAIEAGKGLPRRHHPQYLIAFIDFVVNVYVPTLPSWNAFLAFAKHFVRCLSCTALAGFMLPATVPVAFRTASIKDCNRAALVAADYTEAHEGKLTLLCISRLALLWSLAASVGKSSDEVEEYILAIYYPNCDSAAVAASPASPQKPLPRQPLNKLLSMRALMTSDGKALAAVASSIAAGAQLSLDRAAATKCDAIHVTLLIGELIVPVTRHCEELSWGSVLSDEASLQCIEALLTAVVKVSSCGPNDCPAATHHASAFLLDFDSRCNEMSASTRGASGTQARIGAAAVSALNARATSIIDMVAQGDAAQVAVYRRPLLDVLTWLASQPPNNVVSRARLTELASKVVLLIGAPALLSDSEVQIAIRHTLMATVALLSPTTT